MPNMLEKNKRNISLLIILVGIGLLGVWLLLSNPGLEPVSNRILVRSTGGLAPVVTTDRIPSDILRRAGINVGPADRILVDGQEYKHDQILPPAPERVIQLIPASKITIQQGTEINIISSSASTLGQALWEAGYRLTTTDRIIPPAETLLVGDVNISLLPANEIKVQDGQKTFKIYSSAPSVEEALKENGIPLSALDTTEPTFDQPLPAGDTIKISRVREEIVFNQKIIPFENEKINTPGMDQGKTEIVQVGQNGLEASRERVHFVNEVESDRKAEGSVILRESLKQITNVGTKPVASSVDSGIGSLSYYKTAQVYATSYSPCRQGYDRCSTGTASGTPLKKGIVAVTQAWYKIFGGTQVYIPGYGIGTVADTGGGIPGKYWIDLGYGEDDFVNWHETVTVYFLNPAPANVPEDLP
jgi:uncharacterized protein YabE (DUF348 family)